MRHSSTLLQAVTACAVVVLLASCGGSTASTGEAVAETQTAHKRVVGAESEFEDVTLTESELRTVQIETAAATNRALSSQLSAMGRIIANQLRTAIVSYPFTARISEIDVRSGAWVEAGQKLVVLQSEEVGEATSAYYRANADFQLAELDHERETALLENGVGARKNFLATETALTVAEANRNAAEKKLHVLGFSEEEIRILTDSHQVNPTIALYSPIAGRVVNNNMVLGEMVDESTEIMTIMDPRVLWVDAEIYEKDIAKLRTGQRVAISVPAFPNEVFHGNITYISDVLNDATHTITVRSEVPNTDSRLKPGMFANLEIEFDRNGGATAVPTAAVLDDRGEHLVFVRTDAGRFEPRHVAIGATEGGFVEIASGVEVGEQVVTNGNFQLKSKLYEALLEADHVH